jgi:RNA polymerase sigma-70 factor (ECF subfamily)
MHDDEPLIRQAQAGDAQAFEALLAMYYERMYAFAYKWCANREDAEDVAQQACIKLARGLDQFRFESKFTSWLYRLVINCAKDWQKSQARHQQASAKDVSAAHINAAGIDDYLHENHAVTSDTRPDNAIFLQQLLSRLDHFADGMKETFMLVHAEGFTHGEAAIILNVKESTVSWRLHDIRKRLQPLLGGEAL